MKRLYTAAALMLPLLCLSARGQGPSSSSLEIVSFASTRAYVIGMSPINLVGTVKNHTALPIPANTMRLRMHVLAGLDYLSGDTSPWAPPLEPGASATFRWQVQPSIQSGPLVASLSIECPGQTPLVKLAALPRLAEAPPSESANLSPAPSARAGEGVAILENGKIRARIFQSETGIPILLLSVHTAGGWRQVGTSARLAEVFSGEGGQLPWWEVFKSDDSKATQTKDDAALTLSGMFGVRWRASVTLRLRANSSVIDYELQFASTRQMKLSGVRLCPFLAGDGSFGTAAAEAFLGKQSGPNSLSAVRWGEITFGRLERTELPWKDWETKSLPEVEGAEFRTLGSESRMTETPVTYEAGSIVKLRARLFALTPSATISDAYKVAMPP